MLASQPIKAPNSSHRMKLIMVDASLSTFLGCHCASTHMCYANCVPPDRGQCVQPIDIEGVMVRNRRDCAPSRLLCRSVGHIGLGPVAHSLHNTYVWMHSGIPGMYLRRH